ncbi:MAG: hypothetical protein RL477_1029 [Pseudomonadota bacterium]|jgi:hypothetical protein
MSLLRVFEIHTYRNGSWKIDSVFDDRDLALMEADRIDRSNRYSAVRVVEETFDDETERGGTRTIFRSTKAERINAANQARQQAGLKVAAPPPLQKPKPPKKTVSRQLIMGSIVFSLIVAGGLVVLHLLNQLTGVSGPR